MTEVDRSGGHESLYAAFQKYGEVEVTSEQEIAAGECWRTSAQPTLVTFVQSGIISHRIGSVHGGAISVNRSSSGDLIELDEIVGSPSQPRWMIAIVPTHVARVTLTSVQQVLKQHNGFGAALARAVARKCSLAEEISACNALRVLDVRLAKYLCVVAAESEDGLCISQDVLAQELGAQWVSICLLLDAFSKQGLVEINRGQVRITDGTGLNKLLRNCDR